MSEKVALARNAGYAFAGEIAHKACLLIYGLVIPRYLGPEDYGVYGYALAFVGILKVFIDLGTGTMSVREIARDNSVSSKLMPQLLGMKFTLGVIMFLLVLAISSVAESGKSASALRLLSMTLFLEQGAVYIQLFRALEKMKFYFYGQAVYNILLVISLPFIIIFNLGLEGIIYLQLVSYVIGTFYLFRLVSKNVGPVSIGFSVSYWKTILKASLPFAALSIIWEIYGRVDMVIIPWLNGYQANGFYKIATVIPGMATIIPISIFAAIFPYFTRSAGVSTETIRAAMAPLYRYLSVCGLAIFLLIGVFSVDWVKLLWGSDFTEGAMSLMILCAGVPLAFLTGIHINALYSLDSQNSVLAVAAGTVLIDVILDFVLIPFMGINGAALATLIANVMLFTMTYYFSAKKLGSLPIIKSVAGPIASAAAVYAFIVLVPVSNFPLKLLVSSAALAVALIATKSVTMNDVQLLRAVFKKN